MHAPNHNPRALMIRHAIVAAIVLLLLLAPCCLMGATHTVSTADELKYAMHQLRDGDTVELKAGTYTANDLRITASNVTITSEPGGPPAIIQQKNLPGGSRAIFVIDEPVRNVRIQRLVLRYAYCGIMINRDQLPRASNIRIQDLEGYGFEKALLRAQGYGVEYLYLRNVRGHDNLGSEGAVDIRVNNLCYERGAGSRFILVYGCAFYDNKHTQAGGIIFQESTENWIVLHSRASGNGEQAFCSKSGGLNALINSVGYGNGKCALLYARDTWKIYKDKQGNIIGEIPGDVPSEYLVMGCLGVGRHYLSGDQGAVHLWPNVRAWVYNSTLVSLRKPDGAFTAAPLTVESAPDRPSRILIKNSILTRTTNGPLVNAYDFTELTAYASVRNCFHSLDGRLYRTRLKKNALGPAAIELDPLVAEPLFWNLDPDQDHDARDLRPLEGSPVIRAGQPYGDGPDDWPAQAERLLKHWDEFKGFTCMNPIEQGQMAKAIRNAHLRDLNNRPRDPRAPSIGALE